MSNVRKLIVTGVIGIAILVVAALVAITLLGNRAAPGAGASPPATPPGPPPALAPPAVTASASSPEAPPSEPASPLHTVAPAPMAAPPGDGPRPWEAVPLALRPAGLGSGLAAPVSDGLAAARDGMDPCFDEERQRFLAGKAEPVPAGTSGPAVIVLRLEAQQPGKLVVVGTDLTSRGTSSRALVECCRRALAGYEIDAPSAAPPARYRVQLLLQ
jgi:hypothetical protein